MFEYTNEPYYEEYILKNGKPVKLKLYLPIHKRNEDTNITLVNNPGFHFITAQAMGHNAEETASKTIIDYLMLQYPYIVNNSKELYIQKGVDYYVCGVRVKPELQVEKCENIKRITTSESNYLILESNVMGDYDRYADLLCSFAYENGMDAKKKHIFAVYDTKDSYINPKIKMYCPIKFAQKDKTGSIFSDKI